MSAPAACRVASTLVLCLSLASAQEPTMPIPRFADAPGGGRLHYDGMFYDYLDAGARKGIKLWTPPGDEPLRGILFHGNPGGAGDTRELARDPNLQQFAARHRLGIAGVTWFPGRRVYGETAVTIFAVLDAWAALGDHPELARIPLIPRGSSNAGATAYGLVCFAPHRVLCFTPNVGPMYVPENPPDAALQVPGLLHIGPEDHLLRDGMADTRALFERILPRAPLWSWDAQKGKGHEIGYVDDVDMFFYETCLRLRWPEGADPRAGPVALRAIPRESGWLVDLEGWNEPLVYAAPYADYARDRARAGWVPDADNAFLYRAIAGHDNRLKLRLRDVAPTDYAQPSGVFLRSQGGPIVDPGTQVVAECDVGDLPDYAEIRFFVGAAQIGAAPRGQPARCAFVVDPARTVYALVAVAYDAAGKALTSSNPAHFMVRDPAVSDAIARRQEAYDRVVAPPRVEKGAAIAAAAPRDGAGDGVLIARPLSAVQEESFAATEGVRSTFWDALGAPAARLDASLIRRGGQAPEGQTPGAPCAAMDVRAAYSRAGLYLLFEVDDPSPTGRAGLDDAIDLHLSRESSTRIWDDRPMGDRFFASQFSLSLAGAQYQMALGSAGAPGMVLARNIPAPFDLHRRERDVDALRAEGIVIRHAVAGDGRRVVEWFLPWNVVGAGGPWTQPAAGTRLGLVLGYNDARDGAETTRLRWPFRSDPWSFAAEGGSAPGPWGDVLLAAP